jgi:hypothetical protein
LVALPGLLVGLEDLSILRSQERLYPHGKILGVHLTHAGQYGN